MKKLLRLAISLSVLSLMVTTVAGAVVNNNGGTPSTTEKLPHDSGTP